MGPVSERRRVRSKTCLESMIRRSVCGAAAAVTLAACAGRAPYRVPAPEGTSIEVLADTSETAAGADFAGASTERGANLVENELADVAMDELSATQANDAAADTRPKRGSYQLSAITGDRSEARFRGAGLRGFSLGVRLGESFATGYFRYESRGFVRNVCVGRMTVRAGERLLLGRGLGDYGSSVTGRVRRGFAVSPSLSEWFGVTGAAIEVGRGPWRLETLAFAPPGAGRDLERSRVWSCAAMDFPRGSVSFMAAFARSVSTALPGEPAVARLSAVGGTAAFRGEGFEASAEAARVAGEWYFAGRVASAGRRTRWSFFAFDAPYEVPPGGPGLEAPGKRVQGVAWSLLSRAFGLKGSVRFSGGDRVSSSGRAAYRRLIAEVERDRRGTFRWMLRAYARTYRGADVPTHPVVRELSTESSSELALRAALWVDSHRTVQTGVRVDYMPPTRGLGPGSVVSVTVDIETARIGARLSVSGHSLAPGRRSFVSRPGLGAFEWFGSLYGEGSDLSLRVHVRPTREWRLLFFHGSSWRGAERTYAGIERRR